VRRSAAQGYRRHHRRAAAAPGSGGSLAQLPDAGAAGALLDAKPTSRTVALGSLHHLAGNLDPGTWQDTVGELADHCRERSVGLRCGERIFREMGWREQNGVLTPLPAQQ
jgi:hypothetical protein